MTTHSDIQHQYLNIRVANDTVKPFKPAEYLRNNTNVLLEQPRLYKLSVDRFKIPVNTIPLLIVENLKTGTVNETVYQFELRDGLGGIALQTVEYIPNGLSPNDPRYYYVYSYSRFITMLNNALALAFDTLYPAVPAPPPTVIDYNKVPPHFEFDPVAQKLSLVVPSVYYDPLVIAPLPVWTIRFNFELLRFFQGFESDIITQGEWYQFKTYNRYNNNVIVDVPDNNNGVIPANYLNMLPDINALQRWNELDGIQILTNLPVNQQFVETSDTTASTSSKPILTDFIVLYPDPNSYAATTLDLTTTERSYYDLYGTAPIRNVQFSFLWVSYTGQTYPLYLSKGDAITLKLLFKVRDDIL
jgi:hypothetical protein